MVRGVAPSNFTVIWRSPDIDNGVIINYTITVTNYSSGSIEYRGNVTAVGNDDDNGYTMSVGGLGN